MKAASEYEFIYATSIAAYQSSILAQSVLPPDHKKRMDEIRLEVDNQIQLDAAQHGFEIGKKWAARTVGNPSLVFTESELKQAILSDKTTFTEAGEQLK